MWGKVALIVAAALLLAVAVVIEHTAHLPMWQLLLIYLVPYLLVGHETLHEAAEGLAQGDAFNEHFLMTIATAGALCIGFMPGADCEMAEAVAVMLFFQVGELLEGYAEGRSRDSIAHLMDLRPDVAHVVGEDGVADVAPEQVAAGQTIVVRPGERVPLDGVVVDGDTTLDTVALTGESAPRVASVGDDVLSGCVNLTGVLTLRVAKPYAQSTVARIIGLVEESGERKSHTETFITRFARVYTPIVVAAAVAVALLPPLLSGHFMALLPTWLHRALIFLVVSCPCALVISVPLTFFSGIGGASRRGILVKGANFMDVLARVGIVVFDKTGTLTEGQFAVTTVHPDSCDDTRLLHLAAHVEHHSTHPIAAALRQAFPAAEADDCEVSQIQEVAGEGVTAVVDGQRVSVGNDRLMERVGAQWHPCHHAGTIIHVAIDGTYAGHIVVGDRVKPDSARAIAALKRAGVQRAVMLTGDRQTVGQAVAAQLEIDEFHADLLPADKVAHVERLQAELPQGRTLAMVGDGINDAPVLARADVGIAMGGLGSDAAIEAADVVVMDDHPLRVATAVRAARRTTAIAHQNVVLAIAVKVLVLLLATVGLATMWMAVFADVGVTVMAVLNATRALYISKDE
ncbi:MAG: cadmium-translocating P-type ATPase [Muribaculaceae bacterium]|nr:cadmium-translocating P-type ATPase [Muribaculaceae bacterium]